jgi:hypothetical protein
MAQVEKLHITVLLFRLFIFRWSDAKYFVIVLAYKRQSKLFKSAVNTVISENNFDYKASNSCTHRRKNYLFFTKWKQGNAVYGKYVLPSYFIKPVGKRNNLPFTTMNCRVYADWTDIGVHWIAYLKQRKYTFDTEAKYKVRILASPNLLHNAQIVELCIC